MSLKNRVIDKYNEGHKLMVISYRCAQGNIALDWSAKMMYTQVENLILRLLQLIVQLVSAKCETIQKW